MKITVKKLKRVIKEALGDRDHVVSPWVDYKQIVTDLAEEVTKNPDADPTESNVGFDQGHDWEDLRALYNDEQGLAELVEKIAPKFDLDPYELEQYVYTNLDNVMEQDPGDDDDDDGYMDDDDDDASGQHRTGEITATDSRTGKLEKFGGDSLSHHVKWL